MVPKISAVVIALLVALVLVVRYGRGREPEPEATLTTAPAAPTPAPAPASAPAKTPAELAPPPAERVGLAPAVKSEPPPPASETPLSAVLQGRLDDAVPRPIVDGRVWLHLREAWVEDEPANERGFEAEVRADGSFELTDLPSWRGQILAACRGWVSRPTRFDAIAKATFRRGRPLTFGEIEHAFQEEGGESLEPQRVVVPYPGALVVAMEPTASLEVSVQRPDGSPLAGALVTASPSLAWFGGSTTAFPWREWSATTDAQGLARIDDLPPADALPVGAQHDSFRMPRAERGRTPSVRIVSGETAELRLALEPVEE